MSRVIKLFGYDYVVDKGSLWFMHTKINALFAYEIGKKMRLITTIKGNKSMYDDITYIKALRYHDWLFFIPFLADVMVKYNLNDNSLYEIVLPDCFKERVKFVDAYVMNDKIFCIPADPKNELCIYSIIEDKIEFDEGWKRVVSNISSYFDIGTALDKSVFCSVVAGKQEVVVHNSDAKSTNIVSIRDIEEGIHSCVCVGEKIFFAGMDKGVVYIVNKSDFKVEDKIVTHYDKIRILKGNDDFLVFSSYKTREIDLYNLKEKKSETIALNCSINSADAEYPVGSTCVDKEGNLFYFDRACCELINLSTRKKYSFNVEKMIEFADALREDIMQKRDDLFIENDYFGINEFLTTV